MILAFKVNLFKRVSALRFINYFATLLKVESLIFYSKDNLIMGI